MCCFLSSVQDPQTLPSPTPGGAALCGRVRPADHYAGGGEKGAWSQEAAVPLRCGVQRSHGKALGGPESHGTDGRRGRPGRRLRRWVGTVRLHDGGGGGGGGYLG